MLHVPTRALRLDHPLTSGDVDLLDDLAVAEARESFWAFRCFMNPAMIRGWWQWVACTELQEFYEDILEGLRPTRVFSAPPQHGKSETIQDFCAWVAGKHPEWPQLFSSYSDQLCTKANLKMQRYFMDPLYQKIFPRLRVKGNLPAGVLNDPPPQRNTEIIDFAKYRIQVRGREVEVGGGSFRNPTVGGQATGFGCMLGTVDDAIKGRKEARSPTVRLSVWEWLMDDFFSRFADKAGLLIIATRWHVEDPPGKFIERFPETKVISFPAVAVKDEYLRIDNERKLLRKKGEALFPEHKSLEFLMIRKRGYSTASWESIYQQAPVTQGGGDFPIENFGPVDGFNKKLIKKSIRYWDKAGTEDGGKYTAGVLMHLLSDGTYVVEDGHEGQWGALKREQRILQTAKNDKKSYPKVRIFVEQEPGSGGKESAEATIRMLAGFRAFADRVTDAKDVRAEPYSAQVQNGSVKCVGGPWFRSFADQHEVWPNGPLKDWVDAAAGAFNKLAESAYDSSLAWID